MTRFQSLSILSVLVLASSAHAMGSERQDDELSPEQIAAEKAFSEKLSNSVMIGAFTVDGKDTPPREERYEIKSVTKLTGKQWTFRARIKYGNTDVTVPITVPVEWAGKTPVVTIDDLSIPGMQGSFGARVLFHGDRYVGTWQHDAVGGHMFGRIIQAQEAEEADPGTKQGNESSSN